MLKGSCLVKGQIFTNKHMKINPNNGEILKRVGRYMFLRLIKYMTWTVNYIQIEHIQINKSDQNIKKKA